MFEIAYVLLSIVTWFCVLCKILDNIYGTERLFLNMKRAIMTYVVCFSMSIFMTGVVYLIIGMWQYNEKEKTMKK